jgi:hypothetical protein
MRAAGMGASRVYRAGGDIEASTFVFPTALKVRSLGDNPMRPWGIVRLSKEACSRCDLSFQVYSQKCVAAALPDLFCAIQSEIAKTIAEQLQAKLSPREKNAIERPPTSDISAFDLYARAKALLDAVADYTQAVDLLNRAVPVLALLGKTGKEVAPNPNSFLTVARGSHANPRCISRVLE